MSSPLLFAAAVGLFVLIIFVATWRLIGQRDPVDERLRKFGVSDTKLATLEAELAAPTRRLSLSGTNRMLGATGLGPRLARALSQADLPLTAAEFVMITTALFLVGAVIGASRLGTSMGILIGALLAALPLVYLRTRQRKQQRAFTAQIPEILTLLVGALRAGFGISQAMGVIVDQLAPPASVEFGRVLRAMSLGQPLTRALGDLASRVGTDEVTMLVTAISIQHETGGNLAQTLETIGDTVRDRLRVKGEIRALTSQQRLTGFILAALPLGLGIMLMTVNPRYIGALFQPVVTRLLLMAAIVMQVVGFVVINRIVDIEF